MPLSKIDKITSTFSSQYTGIMSKFTAELTARVKTGQDAEVAIKFLFKKYGIDAKLQAAMMDVITHCAEYGANIKVMAKPLAFKQWYFENAYSDKGVKFSKEINNLSRRDEMIDTILKGQKIGESWRMTAQRLSDKGIQAGDVAADVSKLAEKARQLSTIANDPELYKDYMRQVKRVQARIDTLVEPGTSKLKAAYQSIVDITKTTSQEAIDRAIKYTVYFKERYNAERIVATEGTRAYSQAFNSEVMGNDDIVGVKSALSSAHVEYDVCDFHATADLYGMGPGVWPKENRPDLPYHPWCTCSLEMVYANEADTSAFDPNKGKEFIKGLPASDQESLLGVQGRKDFLAGGNWQNIVKNYDGPQKQKATIPIDILHGKLQAQYQTGSGASQKTFSDTSESFSTSNKYINASGKMSVPEQLESIEKTGIKNNFNKAIESNTLDKKVLSEINASIEHNSDVMGRTPVRGIFVDEIKDAGDGHSIYAAYKDGYITVNEKYASNKARFNTALHDDRLENFHPEGCNTIKSMIDHEIGHDLASEINTKLSRYIDTLTEKEIKGISVYATKNKGELIAEAYSKYLNSDNPGEVSTKIAKLLLRKE
jgi:hypothetical protein